MKTIRHRLRLEESVSMTSLSLTQCGSSSAHGVTPRACCETMRRPDCERTNRLLGLGNMADDVWLQLDRDIKLNQGRLTW